MSWGRLWQDQLCEQGNLFLEGACLLILPTESAAHVTSSADFAPLSMQTHNKLEEALTEKLGYKPCARLVARLTSWTSTFESIRWK